ncbi:hypothetical protein [Rhizorhapis suberifaciens]|uniref:Uncharacterized protein n=1 Tax=Rhizorhapis suberifaciens TaxID=13656 RepID=A0A840HSI1_9SPHN|nr:hypothetical protein [Rhizorhapis suberifaciens]MBB4640671.1 hypothetical protein [Rhizorhapis suberifaciens]
MFVAPFLVSLLIGAAILGGIYAARRRGKLSRQAAVAFALFIVVLVIAVTWFAPIPYIV